MKGLIALGAAALLWAGAAQAQVDQRNDVFTTTSGNFGTNLRFGQSFTPTLSGLNYVTLYMNGTSAGNARSSVTVFQGAGFGGTALGTSNLVTIAGTTNQAYTFSFANLVPLSPDSTYTFAVSSLDNAVQFRAATNNPYAGGTYYYQNGAGAGTAGSGIDVQFIEGIAAAAPESAAWALMILGFGVAGAALRRRPRASDLRRSIAA